MTVTPADFREMHADWEAAEAARQEAAADRRTRGYPLTPDDIDRGYDR